MDKGTLRKTQYGGALCHGGTPVGQQPPPCLPIGSERRPDILEPWDTRLSEGEQADVRCDGPRKAKRRGDSGAFRDARMRIATISMRPSMWGTGQASGLWNCGLCWQRELNDAGESLQTPVAAVEFVRRSPHITVTEDLPGTGG